MCAVSCHKDVTVIALVIWYKHINAATPHRYAYGSICINHN